MAKTKIEKIAMLEEEIKQRENQRKKLIQEQKAQDRKDRTKRLCRRMGLFESLLPDTIPLSEDLFKTFLEKTVITDHSRRILDDLMKQNTTNAETESSTEKTAHDNATAAPPNVRTTAQANTAPIDKTTETAQDLAKGGNGNRGNGAGKTG